MVTYVGWRSIVMWRESWLFLHDSAVMSDLQAALPRIHITDDYLSKNVIGLIFGEITNSHPHTTVSVSRYLVKNIVIFTHLITSAAPSPQNAQQVVSHNLHDQ